MKNIICLLETLTFILGASFIVAGDYEVVRTEREDDSALEYSVAVSSREIYYGDLLYFATLEKNVSAEPIKVPGVPGSVFFSLSMEESAFCLDVTLRYAELANDYRFEYGEFYDSLERQFPYVYYDEFRKIDKRGDYDRCALPTTSTTLSPGQERVFLLTVLDLPALDEWNDPFWRRVRDDLEKRESVTLKVEINYLRLISEKVLQYRRETTDFELVVKRRPQQEMTLLDRWFSDFNDAAIKAKEIDEAWYYVYFPIQRRNVYQLNADKVCKVRISDSDFARAPFKEFNADLARYPFYTDRGAIRSLIRAGNRKPPVTNFPTNDFEWQEIENSFDDSLLKNELRFMRICAKLFSDNTSEEQDELMASYDAWYNDLPLLQRYAFARQLQDDFVRVVKTKLLNTSEELEKHKRLRKNGELFKGTEVIASPLPETK